MRDSWITDDMSVLQKDFYPKDIEPLLRKNKFDGCVAVQADQSETETNFLIELAAENSFIKGVVGWVNLLSPSIEDRLTHFNKQSKLKGVRHVVQGESTGFLMQKDFLRGIKALEKFNLTYDILIREHQLEEAIWFVNQFPNQKFVIDHIAKPQMGKAGKSEWKKGMAVLAAFPNLYCKLSGMVTEANWKSWKHEDFTLYLDSVFENFGTRRLMYGSDWPVCLVAASYRDQLSIVEQYISHLTEVEKQAIMGENAIKFYNL